MWEEPDHTALVDGDHIQILRTELPHGTTVGEYAVLAMDLTTGRRHMTYGIDHFTEAQHINYQMHQRHGVPPRILQWAGRYWVADDASPHCMHRHDH